MTMRRTTIRFFRPEQREAAYRLRDELSSVLRESGIDARPVRVQNFSFYEPKPRPNALEVWFGTPIEPPRQDQLGAVASDRSER
jgi:hypothetical protein